MKNYLKVLIYILLNKTSINKCLLIYNYIKIIYNAWKFKLGKPLSIHNIKLFNYQITFPDYPDLLYLFEEIFVYEIYKCESFIEFPLIIDCGSNIGMAMLYFKKVYPKSTILCFEPHPSLFNLLKENIYQNNLESITPLNSAAFNKTGEMSFFKNRNVNKSLNMSLFNSSVEKDFIIVKVNCLSQFINRQVDLIKIDTEGAEGEIIKDLFRNDKLPLVNKIILEYHDNCNTSLKDIVSMLNKNNFSASYIKKANDLAPEKLLSFQKPSI